MWDAIHSLDERDHVVVIAGLAGTVADDGVQGFVD